MAASLAGSEAAKCRSTADRSISGSVRTAWPCPNAALSRTSVAISSGTPSSSEGCGSGAFSGTDLALSGGDKPRCARPFPASEPFSGPFPSGRAAMGCTLTGSGPEFCLLSRGTRILLLEANSAPGRGPNTASPVREGSDSSPQRGRPVCGYPGIFGRRGRIRKIMLNVRGVGETVPCDLDGRFGRMARLVLLYLTGCPSRRNSRQPSSAGA